jgi:hypothetical protein
MLRTTSIVMLAAAALFGTASAQASGSKTDADQAAGTVAHAQSGASTTRSRPSSVHARMGQRYFRGSPSYAYTPRSRLQQQWYYGQGTGSAPVEEHHSSWPPDGGSGK